MKLVDVLPYDETSKDSILEYGKSLLGKSIRELHAEAEEYSSGKGGLGQTVEKYHFLYEPNSDDEPDFPKAGVELKCTPLKRLLDNSIVSKERLVLNIINYLKEADTTFETSSFMHKNSLLLLMFYLHESGVSRIDLLFKIIRLWSIPEADMKIFRDDWNTIHKKILDGRAHELSEGDTFYLGACVKGDKGGENKRQQPFSDTLADQRAYSIKSNYINTIILDSLEHEEMCSEMFISDKQKKSILKKRKSVESIVKSTKDYLEEETFEELIERKFKPYYGKSIHEIRDMVKQEISHSSKAIAPTTINAILGVKTRNIAEFQKADVQIKSIRLEPNGKLVESMVFSQIQYCDIVKEDVWEESVWYQTLTKRFFFVVFRKSDTKKNNTSKDEYAILEKAFFWTMPAEDLETARQFWEHTKAQISKGDYTHFWKLADHNICHVRPKAKTNEDKMLTPQGTCVTKKGYWLNAEYILKIVNEH